MNENGARVVFALLLAVAAWLGSWHVGTAATQPGYDTIRIEHGGTALSYQVWLDWSPVLLPVPDGSAWAFFSAQVKIPKAPTEEDPSTYALGSQKLYAARFDPITNVWEPARPMRGGDIQFGASAVVDSYGTVHLVYTDRANDQSYGTLVYVKSTPQGGWTDPVRVAPHDMAGHQLSPELVLDSKGGLHVMWLDQRNIEEPDRANPVNADLFVSDLLPGGTWSEPVQVNQRPDTQTNPSRPQLVADGDRLVSVWSVYVGTDRENLTSAQWIEWSERPLDDPEGWSEPEVLFEREDSQIGGRLLDLAADPTGGVVLVYGRRTTEDDSVINTLYLQRLPEDDDEWSEPLELISGTRGSYPRVAIARDGTVYVAYNLGLGATSKVAAVALEPEADVVGPEEMVTAGEDGAQGIPTVAIDRTGRLWVLYHYGPPGEKASEIRVLRGAIVSATPVESPTPAASPTAS
ncbi:MAG TPA: hypothetical protein VIL01_04870 [Thermomicrobiales bacterium]